MLCTVDSSGWAAPPSTGPPGCKHIVSLESDAVHVLVARHIIALAGLSPHAEIIPGMAHDALDRLLEDWGAGCGARAVEHL